MAFFSGKIAGVLVNGITLAFAEWELDGDMDLVKVNNFQSAGAQSLVQGFYKGTVTLAGAHDLQNMPFNLLKTTPDVITLQWTAGLQVSITGYMKNLSPSVKAEDTPRLKVVYWSHGTWTAAVP